MKDRRARRTIGRLLFAALVAAVSACGNAAPELDGAAAAADSAADQPVPHDGAAARAAAPSDSAPAVQPARGSADDAIRLALEGEGLRLFSVPSGAARPLPFGTPAAETLEILRRVRAGMEFEEGENLDCPARLATWTDGLTVWFARDRFVGWSLGRDAGSLTTASGIGIGSTRAELESVYAASIDRTSLGVEFTAGGLAGLLDSAAADARVSNLWAGQVCLAR